MVLARTLAGVRSSSAALAAGALVWRRSVAVWQVQLQRLCCLGRPVWLHKAAGSRVPSCMCASLFDLTAKCCARAGLPGCESRQLDAVQCKGVHQCASRGRTQSAPCLNAITDRLCAAPQSTHSVTGIHQPASIRQQPTSTIACMPCLRQCTAVKKQTAAFQAHAQQHAPRSAEALHRPSGSYAAEPASRLACAFKSTVLCSASARVRAARANACAAPQPSRTFAGRPSSSATAHATSPIDTASSIAASCRSTVRAAPAMCTPASSVTCMPKRTLLATDTSAHVHIVMGRVRQARRWLAMCMPDCLHAERASAVSAPVTRSLPMHLQLPRRSAHTKHAPDLAVESCIGLIRLIRSCGHACAGWGCAKECTFRRATRFASAVDSRPGRSAPPPTAAAARMPRCTSGHHAPARHLWPPRRPARC
jgi:hypothetical protein